ncbi:MAG TPA: hypothetical protein VF590_16765, partial [Isosphaeraceae bacterium]
RSVVHGRPGDDGGDEGPRRRARPRAAALDYGGPTRRVSRGAAATAGSPRRPRGGTPGPFDGRRAGP